MNTIGGLFLIAGSSLILLAGIGVIRFDDIYARMHAGAKAPALGVSSRSGSASRSASGRRWPWSQRCSSSSSS